MSQCFIFVLGNINKIMQQRTSTREDYQKLINLMVEYINNHLGENIDLDTLAGISHFSPYHCYHIFKAFLGEPLWTYVIRMRVEIAACLLRYSDMSVQDIAYKVGYNTPSSLSKVFKQFYCISPIDFRNNKIYTIMKPVQINPDLKLKERIVELEPLQVIYIHLTGNYDSIDYDSAFQKLWTYVKEAGLFSAGIKSISIYHDDPKVTKEDNLRTDVCLIIPKKAEPKGEIGVKQIPGGKYAVYLYQGPYNNLGMVYDTIYHKYIPDGGYQLALDPGFEMYLNNPDRVAPEKIKTEIYIPIA